MKNNTQSNKNIILNTERLYAVVPNIKNLQNRIALLTDPNTTKFLGNGSTRTEQQITEFFKLNLVHFQKHGFCLFDIYEQGTNDYVGDAGLICTALDDKNKEIEVGYRLKKEKWEKGYATELTRAFLKWGFTQYKLTKIVAYVNSKNIASKNVVRKSGMHYGGKAIYPSPSGAECDFYYLHNVVLETKNFYLRLFDNSDLNLLHNLGNDPGVIKNWQCKPWPIEIAKTRLARFSESFKELGITKYAVFQKHTNEFMGYCGFSNFYDPDNDRTPKSFKKDRLLELGYALHEKFWGKGYATEITKSCVEFAIKNFPNKQIVAVTSPHNLASQRVLEKLGFVFLEKVKSKKFDTEYFFLLEKKLLTHNKNT